MSVDRKEIDLIIRAALQGGKTLEGVTKSINQIEKALESQAAAAKRGESSIDDLKSTLEALKRTQDDLKDQAGLINQFDRLAKQIEKSSERVTKNAQAYADYKAKIEKAGEATDKQRERLVKLAGASERAETTLAKQRTDQQSLAASLREVGIETDRLAESETRVRSTAAQLGAAILRTQQAISSYADDVRRAREAEQALSDEKMFQQKLSDAAKLNKAGEYVRFWTQALGEADAAEEQSRINASLHKAADEAVAAARGYKTLGTAAKTLASPSTGLRDVIQGIVDPAQQARTTLSGVEEQVRKLNGSISSIKGPITDYKDKVKQLAAAQKSLADQAGLIDSYNKQLAALRSARSDYSKARTEVLQYAEALRNSKGQNDQLQASLRTAQATLAAAQRTLASQVVTTRDLRTSLREAGIATNDLSGSQARLTSSAQASTSAMRNLDAAKRKYGEAVRTAAGSMDLFSNSGRTTLSLLQRIRGEVLSVVAAYVGLYGAINGASSAIEAFNTKRAIQNQLALSVGNDNAAIAAEYQYIREQADRLGISFEAAAKGYAKFSASAKLAGRDTQEIRYIFETFSEVGRVANLSTDELDGVFKALEQIVSKGKIQAEELRGQLGDRLFGAFQVAAQALKDQFPELDKAMKNGLVTSDQLIKIAEKYKEIVGPRLSEATTQLSANQARLNSALFDFKVLVAEQGFADEYARLVETLTTFFKSQDGKKFAKDLSDGLSIIVRGLRWVVENLETVKTVLELAFGLYASRLILGIGASVLKAAGTFKALTLAMGETDGMRSKLMKGFIILNTFFVGWEIGTILSQKFEAVRKAGIALAIGFEATFVRIKYGAKILADELPAVIQDGLSRAANEMTKLFRGFYSMLADGYRLIGADGIADALDAMVAKITLRTDRVATASTELRAQMERELAKIADIGWEMWQAAENPGTVQPANPVAKATDKPNSGGTVPTGSTEAEKEAADKRLKIREQLENELTSLEAKIEKNEKDNLERRLLAIDLIYQKLLNKIRAFGGKDGAALEVRLGEGIAALKLQETKKFNDALLDEQTALQTKLEQVDAKIGNKQKTDIQARLEAVKVSYADTYREIAEYEAKLIANGRDTGVTDAMRARLDAGVLALQNLERQKYYEDAINELIEERKAKLDTIEVMEKTGLITATQARERSAQVVNETQPKMEALVAEGLNYVEAMILAAEATGANVTTLETLKAKLIEARESVKGVRTEFISVAEVNEMIASGATTAFTGMAEAIGGALTGLHSWKDAIEGAKDAFLSFASDFLMQIAQMILKQAILNALQGSTTGGIISGAINAVLKHDGGVVGAGGRSRMASPAWFANAPRYHGGGIPGLAADEYPAILKKNEEVLTQSDPRNILNAGKAQSPEAMAQSLRMILVDDQRNVGNYIQSAEGERVLVQTIRRNAMAIKQAIR